LSKIPKTSSYDVMAAAHDGPRLTIITEIKPQTTPTVGYAEGFTCEETACALCTSLTSGVAAAAQPVLGMGSFGNAPVRWGG
jgi:hypothetical protein